MLKGNLKNIKNSNV